MIPQYREASSVKKKSKLLDAFTATTGYKRKYAMWLLNHAKEVHCSTTNLTQRPTIPKLFPQENLQIAGHFSWKLSIRESPLVE
jgi:hypothetical protein